MEFLKPNASVAVSKWCTRLTLEDRWRPMQMMISTRLTHRVRILFVSLVIWAAGPALGTAGSEPAKPDQPSRPSVSPSKGKDTEVKPADATAQNQQSQIIVAQIGPYQITREQLEKRLMQQLNPYDYDWFDQSDSIPDANSVLTAMVAEKAIILEARKQKLHEEEPIRSAIEMYENRRLVSLLLQDYLRKNLTVTREEVQRKLKADPKLDQARAVALIQRAKANKLLDEYYDRIYQDSNVKKLTANFAKAAEIHQRLLLRPKKQQNVSFIRISQINTDLTEEEKALVLATFEGGKITLKDWFQALCEIAPPRRPRNLGTAEGVEKFLDAALRIPILVAEAKRQRLDKNPDFIEQIRNYEDLRLLGQARLRLYDQIEEPNSEEIRRFFEANKQKFRPCKLVIDQIWCKDLKTAWQARADLDAGADFGMVKEKYSLEKDSRPATIFPNNEGYFWSRLWRSEPNDVLGPIKGFHDNRFRWRIVKIVEKDAGQVPELDEQMTNRVKWRILSQRRKALLRRYEQELLKKYPYKIYTEAFKDLDPLAIP